MKIYFCGSIRGGRNDAAKYKRMIDALKLYGTVLTEHVGDPSLTDKGGDGGSAYIWQRDTDWLKECDLVIAECTQPSLGVGYELAFARFLEKPVHIFYGGEEGRLSAMLAGDPAFHIHEYREEKAMLREMIDVVKHYSGTPMKKTKGANTLILDENEVKFDELSEEQLKEVSGGVTFPVPRPSDSERGGRLDNEDVSWTLDDDDDGGWTAEPSLPTKPGTYELYGISY